MVTNLDDPTNPVVYYGNDIPSSGYSTRAGNPTNIGERWTPSTTSRTSSSRSRWAPTTRSRSSGRAVNVNAVSAQTNTYAGNVTPTPAYAPNVVQDYALVICGRRPAFTVTDNGISANPTGDQNITFVTATNDAVAQPVRRGQLAGAGHQHRGRSARTQAYGGNAQVTLGMTNQWHFYVVTNNAADSSGDYSDVTNAAFVTFSPRDALDLARWACLPAR